MNKSHYSMAGMNEGFIEECKKLVRKSNILSEKLDMKIKLISEEQNKKKLH